ncbi:hypothetical protein ACTJKC_01880 [Pedobacter sp. 22226]|uniref:hypothetical protein n=1 Tax=Pedobacter sp. 22226 TaxID=3453894 RepID=UPI003F84B824
MTQSTLKIEQFGLPSTEQFATKLIEISDFAFSFGMDSIPETQKNKPGEKWNTEEMNFFMDKCREGFKSAQKLLIKEVLFYQQELRENKESIIRYRSAHAKEKIKEYTAVGKVIVRRLHNLSHIADGMVIQLLSEQVHVARRLNIGEKSNKQLEHSNLEHAIKISDQLNEDPGTFALISDLTSYVQIGDLLVTDSKKGLYITELKEGKTNERIREFIDLSLQNGMPCPGFQSDFSEKERKQMQRTLRQDLRAQQATEIINTDRGTDPETGAEMKVNTPTIDPVYFDGLFLEMLEELKTGNWSYRLIDGCLHLGLYHGDTAHLMAQVVIPSILKKQTQNSIVIDLMQITEELSETLFAKPFSKDFVVKIMTGQIKVIIGIDLDELIKTFNRSGLKTRWLSTKETTRMKELAKGIKIVTSKNRAIGIELVPGEQGVMSGGIISKIAFDHILPSNLAESMVSSKPSAAETDTTTKH